MKLLITFTNFLTSHGPDPQVALLGFYSEFFDAAFYGGFNEAEKEEIELPYEKPENVSAFLMWAYSGHIESPQSAEELLVAVGFWRYDAKPKIFECPHG